MYPWVIRATHWPAQLKNSSYPRSSVEETNKQENKQKKSYQPNSKYNTKKQRERGEKKTIEAAHSHSATEIITRTLK